MDKKSIVSICKDTIITTGIAYGVNTGIKTLFNPVSDSYWQSFSGHGVSETTLYSTLALAIIYPLAMICKNQYQSKNKSNQ